jgi:biotin operon repressor
VVSIIEYIKSHGGLPISAKNLSDTFGISGLEVRKIINSARSEGCPICSCYKGYYYSENEREIQKTIDSLNGRIGAMERAKLGLSKCLRGTHEV